MSVIGELAAFVTGAKASALPAAERERLELHLTDTVVAALAGACIPEGKALQSFGDARSAADRIGRRAAGHRSSIAVFGRPIWRRPWLRLRRRRVCLDWTTPALAMHCHSLSC